MNRSAISVAIAATAGVGSVYVLPPPWLAPIATAVAVLGAILALVVRLSTPTSSLANPMAGVLLSIANLPEQPLAKVKENWALTAFLTSAAFLVSLGISIMVRANA